MKKFATMVTSVALIGAMVAGGSLAYLSDTDSAVNVMELGSVNIEQIEQERNAEGKLVDFTQGKPLLPYVGELGWKNTDVDNGAYRSFTMNNVVDKYVSVKNTGKSDAYVRTIIALEMGEIGVLIIITAHQDITVRVLVIDKMKECFFCQFFTVKNQNFWCRKKKKIISMCKTTCVENNFPR